MLRARSLFGISERLPIASNYLSLKAHKSFSSSSCFLNQPNSATNESKIIDENPESEVAVIDEASFSSSKINHIFDVIDNKRELSQVQPDEDSNANKKLLADYNSQGSNLIILRDVSSFKRLPKYIVKYKDNAKAEKKKNGGKTKGRKSDNQQDDVAVSSALKSRGSSSGLNVYHHLMDKVDEQNDILPFVKGNSDNDLLQSITELKPKVKKISPKDYKELYDTIYKSYTKVNLMDYVKKLQGFPIAKSKVKKVIIEKIVKELWNVETDFNVKSLQNGSGMAEKIQTKTFDVNDKISFFLLSESGRLLFKYTTNFINIMFNRNESDKKLVVQATGLRLNWFEADLNKILSSLKKQFVDLGALNSFFNKDKNNVKQVLPLDYIQKVSDVYFEKVAQFGYILNARYNRAIQKAQRFLVWFLNYNSHLLTNTSNFQSLISSSDLKKSLRFYRFADYMSLPWIHRSKVWYRLRAPTFNKSYKKGQAFKTREISLSDKQIDEVYDSLFKSNLSGETVKGLPSAKWNKPDLTATFGQLLVDETMKNEALKSLNSDAAGIMEISSNDAVDSSRPYIFSTSLPDIKKEAYKLPMFYQSEADTDMGMTEHEDNHSYYVQIKFSPSPFVDITTSEEDSGNLMKTEIENYSKYPPIEAWVEINGKDEVQWDTLSVMTVEKESNVYVNFPDKTSDLNLSSATTGNLIDLTTERTENEPFNINEALRKQPDLLEYFKASDLSYQKRDFRLEDNVKIFFENEGRITPVEYMFINACFRKQLNLEYNNGYLLQLSSIEGGFLGGSRVEVSLVNYRKEGEEDIGGQESAEENDNGEISREEFGSLLRESLKFINSVSTN
ncbi:Sls1 protein [Saccharomycopsis crataegensis]|uniref:Sls1 protein n=1 Tax=Saccharomycopsis crataegensis TaxID=43959 RepID=A0AAV5QFX0_9ASCO|nr:Sls1 protein [Saccharomycopsis crataegensis]